METTELRPFPVATTRSGFGCAGLLRVPSRRQRQLLLETAFDQGIRHFDVARMYGLGAAEAELGRFAKGRRDQVVLATKYGIQPPAGSALSARLQAPGRWLLRRVPSLRRHARRGAEGVTAPRRYDATTARESLETSLRALATDHVDILFLHEPAPGEVGQAEDVAAFLEDARRKGQLRAWGVSGELDASLEVAGALGFPLLLQVRDDLLARPEAGLPRELGPAPLTFGVLSRALPRTLAHATGDAARRSRWMGAVGVDCGDPGELASLLLRSARRANPAGVIVFSTTRPERIATAVGSTASPPADDQRLDAFERLVAAELRPAASPSRP